MTIKKSRGAYWKNTPDISIDSRTIKKGQVFVAIKGPNFDGHNFVARAFQKGASAAIVSRGVKAPARYRSRIVRVNDTVRALGELARAHRMRFKIPVIAVTGSNGKTTTKDILAHILSARYSVLKSEASYNNRIGVPLTLLKMRGRHEAVVLEIGMNRKGEIGMLARMAAPDIAIITNIGPAHLGPLKTLGNIFRAKRELLEALGRRGTAVLNKDDRFLRGLKNAGCKKVYFGIREKCAFRAVGARKSGSGWSFGVKGIGKIRLSSPGRHNIYNTLAAIAASSLAGVSRGDIKKRVESFRMRSPKRLDLRVVAGRRVIDDTYNSNPASFKCALELLESLQSHGKKIVVSGDMLELGAASRRLHAAAGEEIAGKDFDALITLGPLSRFTASAARKKGLAFVRCASSHREAAKMLNSISERGDLVLIKGSRGMQMERVIDNL